MSSHVGTSGLADAYIERQDAALKPLLLAVRQLLRESAPKAHETIKWSSLCYEQEGVFCSIMPSQDYLRLQFFRGNELHDPDCLLEGTGRAMRHIKIHNVGQTTPWEAINALVQDAVRVNLSR